MNHVLMAFCSGRSGRISALLLALILNLSAPAAMRILFVTIEFRSATFSGNGVYASSQVRALSSDGHQVLVVAARPKTAPSVATAGVALDASTTIEVPVDTWNRLDASTPWQQFAAGVLDDHVTAAVRQFAPEAVLGVDWSALQACRNLMPYTNGAPYVYLNYRVFTRTATGEDLELVRRLEAEAMAEAAVTVALSRSDADYLMQHVVQHAQQHHTKRHQGQQQPAGPKLPVCRPKVLLPALREDVRQLAPPPELLELAPLRLAHCSSTHQHGQQQQEQQHEDKDGEGHQCSVDSSTVDGVARMCSCSGSGGGSSTASDAAGAWLQGRQYLSCVVRLSAEKEPERFVELVEAMAAAGLLQQHQLTPLMLGAAKDDYAQSIKDRLRAAAPDAVILESFMGPADLAAVYRRTRLNVHPSTYDAYGMTIVEAASQGAPSIVHDGNGAVGATDLLSGADGEVFLLDLTAPPAHVAAAAGRLLAAPEGLAATAARAMRKARSWDEAANAGELVALVRQAVEGRGSGAAVAAA